MWHLYYARGGLVRKIGLPVTRLFTWSPNLEKKQKTMITSVTRLWRLKFKSPVYRREGFELFYDRKLYDWWLRIALARFRAVISQSSDGDLRIIFNNKSVDYVLNVVIIGPFRKTRPKVYVSYARLYMFPTVAKQTSRGWFREYCATTFHI